MLLPYFPSRSSKPSPKRFREKRDGADPAYDLDFSQKNHKITNFHKITAFLMFLYTRDKRLEFTWCFFVAWLRALQHGCVSALELCWQSQPPTQLSFHKQVSPVELLNRISKITHLYNNSHQPAGAAQVRGNLLEGACIGWSLGACTSQGFWDILQGLPTEGTMSSVTSLSSLLLLPLVPKVSVGSSSPTPA